MSARMNVHPPVVARWSALDDDVRAHVTSFLAPLADARSPARGVLPGADDASLPDRFARDLAAGGRSFREAFPHLERRVAEIRASETAVTVHVTCEGTQLGSFFGIFRPTGRHVSFEARHEVVLRDGQIVEARVTLDVRAIVRQIARPRHQA